MSSYLELCPIKVRSGKSITKGIFCVWIECGEIRTPIRTPISFLLLFVPILLKFTSLQYLSCSLLSLKVNVKKKKNLGCPQNINRRGIFQREDSLTLEGFPLWDRR